jgi:cobalamin synthase
VVAGHSAIEDSLEACPDSDWRKMTKRTFIVGVVTGAAAGMAMAGVEMIYGWASSAHTAWDAPMGIWAFIGGLNHFGHPANHIWPILLGIGGHMMNAIFIGIVFVALMRILRNPPGALLIGAASGVGIWALQRYVFLPINTPEDRLFMTSTISPQWVWWLAHVALGTTLGLVYVLLGRRQPAAPASQRLSPVRERRLHAAL